MGIFGVILGILAVGCAFFATLLFGTAGQTVLPAATLPVNPLESLTVPSSAESEPVSTAVSTEDTTEAPAEETTTEADTTEMPETTAEPDTAEVPTEPEGSTDEPSESSSGETAEPSETDDTAGTAESTPENDAARLRYSTLIRQLQRGKWDRASALMCSATLE